MHMRILGGVAALALSLASPAAHADTHALARAGSWEAFGGTTSKGRPLCGVSRDVDNKYFGLKLYSGDSTFTIQIGGKTWNIENGAKQDVVMTMDGNSPWKAVGVGMHFDDGDAGLEFTVKRGEVGQFTTEFRNSGQLRLHFPGSSASDWVIGLSGTSAVSGAFEDCMRNLK